MSAADFEAFRRELDALKELVARLTSRTVRDSELLVRFQNLNRTWVSSISPSIETYLTGRRDLLKLTAEVEAIAKLTTKYRPVTKYRKRLNTAIQLAAGLVIYLPPSAEPGQQPASTQSRLFLDEISDLPAALVPTAIFGSRSRLQEFVARYPFDRSVFIMIRYRARTEPIISRIKSALEAAGFNGIVAKDHKITDDLYNPIACLLACGRGIAVFDHPEPQARYNPNVAYELGMMHLLQRPCLLLKHQSIQTLHTDILMKLYVPFSTAVTAAQEVERWLAPTDQSP